MPPFPHGGHLRRLARQSGREPADILDFSANINPLGPPPWLRTVIGAHVSDLVHYPDPECAGLIKAAARRYETPEEELLAGNGASQLLFALARVLGRTRARAVVPVPCYVDYLTACRQAGLILETPTLPPEAGFLPDLERLAADLPADALVLLASPGNPSGAVIAADGLRALAISRPDCLFVLDEAFADFVPGFDSLTRERPDNVAVLLSLTKTFAIPGLRLGLLAARSDLCRAVAEELPSWSVNALAQAVGEAALADAAFVEQSRTAVAQLREVLVRELSELPNLEVFPGRANYLLCRLTRPGAKAADLAARLLADHGIAVRDCANYQGLSPDHFRAAVRPAGENARLVAALARILDPDVPRPVAARKTPALMVQGTTSNAGKSLLCAALCRILRRKGLDVAPFKAQNMSLNSHVTRDGLEMGRAQVLQAQACRLEPDARMNPILLKPTSERGSQVIVLGRPVGVMPVREYVRYKPLAFARAKAAYDELAGEHAVMILEGAGSPAEVNLKAHDIVNMAMAEYADARVLLVSDIDRGGSFAHLLGTMDCLTEAERARTAGYVLNRFRGDASLLEPALVFIRRATGREILGVVPNIEAHGLPEEDSVSFKAGTMAATAWDAAPGRRPLDLAVLDLPRLSNFTDLDALAAEPDVGLRLVREPRDLDRVPDALILPGSKNTLADLAWMRDRGLDAAVLELAGRPDGPEIVGVCAGMQLLGRTIADPDGLESGLGGAPGLGLLPIATEMASEKTLTLAEALHEPTGLALRGYEIHHGRTRTLAPCPTVVRRADGQPLGHGAPNGRTWGSYLHGIFDADAFRRRWLDGLRQRKGLPPLVSVTPYDLEPALERLADVVEEHVEMKRIMAFLGL